MDKQHQQYQKEQLAEKLRLEKKFAPVVKKTLQSMSDTFARVYYQSGVVVNADDFSPIFASELTAHYEETTKKFAKHINEQATSGKIDNRIALAFIAYAAKRGISLADAELVLMLKQDEMMKDFIKTSVNETVEQIALTNAKEFNKAIENTIGQLVNEGTAVNHETIGAQLSESFMSSNGYRAETIAQVETQNAAEGGKNVAANSINDIVTSAQPDPEPVFLKEWVTVGDEKVRAAHAAADGQTKKIQEPFIVGGELLKFPSDESLGATPGNTINCRCSSDYVDNPNFDNVGDNDGI